MIENETQYKTTKAQIDRFEKALVEISQEDKSLLAKKNRLLWEATKDSITSILEELIEQVIEYEAKNGKEKE